MKIMEKLIYGCHGPLDWDRCSLKVFKVPYFGMNGFETHWHGMERNNDFLTYACCVSFLNLIQGIWMFVIRFSHSALIVCSDHNSSLSSLWILYRLLSNRVMWTVLYFWASSVVYLWIMGVSVKREKKSEAVGI